jgi:hypothetical protein
MAAVARVTPPVFRGGELPIAVDIFCHWAEQLNHVGRSAAL